MTRLLILFLGLALSRNTQRGTSGQATPEDGLLTIRQVKTSCQLPVLFLLNKVGNKIHTQAVVGEDAFSDWT